MRANARTCPRLGLTRIDVLVTASLGFFLLGILLPCVQAARSDSDRTICTDNLRKLGLGFHAFEQANGGLPPRRAGFNDGTAYCGWGAFLLGHIGETELANKYNFKLDCFDPGNKAVTETQVKTFLCPASPPNRKLTIQAQATGKSENPDKDTIWTMHGGVNDYISSNGVLAPRSGYGMNAGFADQMLSNQRQPMTDNVYVPFSKITDGLSCTLLIIEQAGRPEVWRGGKKKNENGLFGMAANARGSWAGWGSIAFGPSDADGAGPAKGDNTDCSVNCSNDFGIYGFHDGGANVLLCDGAVRFVGKKLDPLTFIYLTIRDDGHLLAPTDY